MSKRVTKALTNRYCQARLKAAEYNPDFSSRRGAVEHLSGISEDALKKYELGICNPSNDVVAIMADAYNAPELVSWYCCNECALGHQSTGTYSLSSDKSQMFTVAIGSWLDVIRETFENKAIPLLVDINSEHFKGISGYPRLSHGEVENRNLGELAEYIKALSGAGIIFDDEQANYLFRAAKMPEHKETEL